MSITPLPHTRREKDGERPARRLKLVRSVMVSCTWAKISNWQVYDVLPPQVWILSEGPDSNTILVTRSFKEVKAQKNDLSIRAMKGMRQCTFTGAIGALLDPWAGDEAQQQPRLDAQEDGVFSLCFFRFSGAGPLGNTLRQVSLQVSFAEYQDIREI